MNKYVLLIIFSCFIIYILVYFYDERESFLEREYYDYENNIYINYPYFNNYKLDSYINNYLNSAIKDSSNSKLFIDYDYSRDSDNINLFLYSYKCYDNVMKKSVKKIVIDSNKNYSVDNVFGYSKNNKFRC